MMILMTLSGDKKVEGGGIKYQFADVHPCTEEEYAKFWPASPGSKGKIEKLREKKEWMCPN